MARRLHLAALLGATALAALPAAAQDSFVLDEIVFSATLAPASRASLGSSVTIITEEDLDAAGDVLVSDFLNRLAGLSVARVGPPGAQTALRVRGAHPRYVAVRIDGVLVNDPASPDSAFNFGTLTTSDIGRIEVLRGAQSALFGATAAGGVIDITTRTAAEEGLTQSLRVEAGSFNTFSGRYGFTQRSEATELAFSLSHFRSDGFSAVDGGEPDGLETTRLSLSASHQLGDTFTVGGSVFGQRARLDFDPWPNDGNFEERRREIGGRLFVELETGAIRHVVDVTSYRVRRSNRDLDAGSGADRFEGTRIGASYVGSAPVGPDVTLSVGADVRREVSEADARFNSFERRRETMAGMFAESLWAVTPTLDLSATVRVDHHSEFGSFRTGRLAAAWRPDAALTLRAALSSGYRPPATGERFGVFGNPALQPETSRSAEIGAEFAFAAGGQVSATVFRLETDDEITFDPSFTPSNIERTRRTGLEIAGSLPLGERVTLGAAYTVLDAEITGGPQQGQRLLRVPRHDLSLSVDAVLTQRLRGSIALQHVADRRDVRTDFSRGPMPDYTVVNMNFRFAVSERSDLTLRVDNLLDRQYQQVAGYGTSDRAFYVGLASRF
ncbi:MAG: TonB-dependent receptor plug domain-containing protein [Alkalilacustris sp.]